MADIKVGSRVKVTGKEYNRYDNKHENFEFKGEIFDISKGDGTIHIIGFKSSDPKNLAHLKIGKEDIISIGGTRLPKYFSEYLTKYIKHLRDKMKYEQEIAALRAKQNKIDSNLNTIKENLPKEYYKNNKGKLSGKDILGAIMTEVNKNGNVGFYYPNDKTVAYDIDLVNREFRSKYIDVVREYDGQAYVPQHTTQEDIRKHLKDEYRFIFTSSNSKLDFLKPVTEYFDIRPNLNAWADTHNDMSFNISCAFQLKIKSTTKESDIQEAAKTLNAFVKNANNLKVTRSYRGSRFGLGY